MSNDMENTPACDDDGRSPCVRAFVANFERRDSNAGIGNENRPPVMTKSKVALLRQTLGKTSDSVKGTLSDSESSCRLHEAGDSDGPSDGSEQIVSVAKLKENLQKSVKGKPVVPWGLGGAGRSVKEAKKPTPKHRNDVADVKLAKTDPPPNAADRSKRRLNSSFKESQRNRIESSDWTESFDESVFVGRSVTASEVANQGNGFPAQFSRSSSNDNQIGEKHKLAPKVLPKPVPRKSKAKLVNVNHERSQSDDKCERTAYDDKNATLDGSSKISTSGKLGSNESLLGNSAPKSRSSAPEVLNPESGEVVIHSEGRVNHLRDLHQTENTSVNVAGEETHDSTNKARNVGATHTETTEHYDADRVTSSDKLITVGHLETCDEDAVRVTDASYAVPLVAARTRYTSSIDDENSDDDQEVDDAIIVTRSINQPGSLSDHDRVSSEVTSMEQNDHASSNTSSDLVITDDESTTDDNRRSKTESESTLPSEQNRAESPDEDVMHSNDSISLAQDSTRVHCNLPENGDAIESPSGTERDESVENSCFLLCMGPDFITDIKDLGATTAEEEEYEALASVVCCKMLEQEEEGVSWVLCPPETYRSTVDYVGSLFEDDILVGLDGRKSGSWAIEESSFMSSDSLREALLDKATKKLERLKLQKQKLEAASTKQVELEELVDRMVKERVDSRQYSKYRSTLEEFDQVTHLLLMLSSRLANTDNSLDQISFSDQEQQKVQLISKRDNLIEKFKEAQSIKESSDTRRRQLADCLQKHLTATEFLDYRQLLKTKCQLKIVRHTLEDRASLSEEQIKILVAIIEKNTSARYC